MRDIISKTLIGEYSKKHNSFEKSEDFKTFKFNENFKSFTASMSDLGNDFSAPPVNLCIDSQLNPVQKIFADKI